MEKLESYKLESYNNEALAEHKYWSEEFNKCLDPWYFFVNYCIMPDGSKPTITREEYYERLGFYKNESIRLKKRG